MDHDLLASIGSHLCLGDIPDDLSQFHLTGDSSTEADNNRRGSIGLPVAWGSGFSVDDSLFSKPLDVACRISQDIRRDILQLIGQSLNGQEYLIIGGCALAQHGWSRWAGDVDILTGPGLQRDLATGLLAHAGSIVHTRAHQLLYQGKDGKHYKIDVHSSECFELPLEISKDACRFEDMPGINFASIGFLINSKAHAWQTRGQNDMEQWGVDEADLRSLLLHLQQDLREDINPDRLGWLYASACRVPFFERNADLVPILQSRGLWREASLSGVPVGKLEVDAINLDTSE